MRVVSFRNDAVLFSVIKSTDKLFRASVLAPRDCFVKLHNMLLHIIII